METALYFAAVQILDFLSPELRPTHPQLIPTEYKIQEVTEEHEYELRVNKVQEIKQSLTSLAKQ